MQSTLKIIIFLALICTALQLGFQCNINNCQSCSYPNFCGLCNNNYLLTLNNTSGDFYCQALSCTANCATCFQNNTCQTCNSNFYLMVNGTCSTNPTSISQLPPNCIWASSTTNCGLCAYGYVLKSNSCYPIIQFSAADQNCVVKMSSSICQICKQNFVVNMFGNCVQNQVSQICGIANCAYCQNSNSTCLTCVQGYQLSGSGTCLSPSCSIQGCSLCFNSTACETCLPQYTITTSKTCQSIGTGCNINNCITCLSAQSCGQCKVGYELVQFITTINSTTNNNYFCKKIICPFNITNCNLCIYNYNNNFQYNQILCSSTGCSTGYSNVNGFCVPNINTTAITCNNVTNCLQCSFTNFCTLCQSGYSLTSVGTCQINVCNVGNCAVCSLNNICSQCSSSYSLTISNLSLLNPSTNTINFLQFILLQQCTLNTNISCTNANCQSCSSNNICGSCVNGYDFDTSNTNCVPTCNISNCYTCSQSLNFTSAPCLACNPGYLLSSNNMQCTPIIFSCGLGCVNSSSIVSCIYNPMSQQGQCIQCMSGMILYNGSCYSSTCNIYGCQICAPWVPSTTVLCIQCQTSLVLSNGYCIIPNCDNNIPNCVNCIQNGICVGCKQGYYIQNNTNGTNTCVSHTSILNCNIQNCIQCQSGNSNICTKCATPYIVLNGQCVCGFQNCLDCSTTILACNLCPTPLISTLQTPNCLPPPSLINTCNVSNCQACLSINQCSICSLGYTLNPSDYSCTMNNCSALNQSNCQLCDQFGYACHLCNTGYMINNFLQGGSCQPINVNYTCNITGCAVCSSTNNSICSMCLPTYYSNGTTQCIPNSCNISNCYLCLNNNNCTVCDTGYYLALDLSCQPKFNNIINCQGQIQYCDICVTGLVNTGTTPYCIRCQDGFQFNIATSQCVPQQNNIPNCKVQLPDYSNNNLPMCIVCEQGYFVNSWGLCSLFNPNITNSGCTVYNCLYCALNSTTCSFCFSPWGISSTGICQTTALCANLTNCQACINSTYCSSCVTTYLPNNVGQCVLCNIVGCSYCTNANNCSVCLSGYQVDNNGLCISCNMQNCNNCSNNNVCSQCLNGLVPSSTGGSCVNCTLNNCISCSANGICGICTSGYQLITTNTTGLCIQCNPSNCISCLSNNVCGNCALGYSLINGNCVSCQYPCATCNSNVNCASCQTPLFASVPLTNGSCIQSTIPNCISYNTTNTSICTQCNSTAGYTLNTSSNTCNLICNSICATCNSSNTTQCLTCPSGFYLMNQTCIQCGSTGCSTCNSSGCITCVNGFYFISNECKQCPSYCASCSSATICTSLIQSNQQVLMQINSITYLAICPSLCLTCSNLDPSICLSCFDGFYFNNNTSTCSPCNQTCKTCAGSNLNQCLSCYPNNFYVNNTCIPCSNPCQTCLNSTSLSTCLTCYPGSYLNNNTCTSGCSVNCLTCNNPKQCTLCDSGYSPFTLNNNNVICVQCTSNCRTCAAGLPASCLSCGNGFNLNNGQCMACTPNCVACLSPTSCSGCVSGFFLTSSLTCSVNCQIPCATCSANNPTKCSSCIAGYTYNSLSFSCTQQTSCNGACSVCPIGYLLQAGQCTQCTTSNCQLCSNSSFSTCLSCAPGFYLNPANGQCKTCLPQCATCLRPDGCLTCTTGYTYLSNVNIAGSGYQCIPCNFPCATCLNDPDYCTSCVSGYQFMGWKCSQSFYFQFSVTLLTNSTVFNPNYYNFLLALASSIGSTNPQIITITGITFSSVIVSGGVAPTATSGTLQSNQQFSSFDATLATNNVIAGMTVGSATISVIGGTIDYSKINLALILGITIPVAVLIIAGIILYIYCKKKKSSDILEEKIKEQSGFTVRQSFQLSTRHHKQETTRPFEDDTAIN